MNTLRLRIAWVLSVVGYALAWLAVWIAGIREVDPTVEALAAVRSVVSEMPYGHDGYLPRAAVLAAIGQAITDAER